MRGMQLLRPIALTLAASLILASCAPAAERTASAASEEGFNCTQAVRTDEGQPFLLSLVKKAGGFIVNLATTYLTDTLISLFEKAGNDAEVRLVFPDGTVSTAADAGQPNLIDSLLSGGLQFETSEHLVQTLIDLNGPLLIQFEGDNGEYELSVTTEALSQLDIDYAVNCR